MKKIALVGMMVAAMVLPGLAHAKSYPDGDANCSGRVTRADVRLLSDVILEKPGAELGECRAKVDLDCNGTLNIFDVVRLQRLADGYSISAC